MRKGIWLAGIFFCASIGLSAGCSGANRLQRHYFVAKKSPVSLSKTYFVQKKDCRIGFQVLQMHNIQKFLDKNQRWTRNSRIPYLLYLKIVVKNTSNARLVIERDQIYLQATKDKLDNRSSKNNPSLMMSTKYFSLSSGQYNQQFWALPYQAANPAILFSVIEGNFVYDRSIQKEVKKDSTKQNKRKLDQIIVLPQQELTTILALEKPDLFHPKMRLFVPVKKIPQKQIKQKKQKNNGQRESYSSSHTMDIFFTVSPNKDR